MFCKRLIPLALALSLGPQLGCQSVSGELDGTQMGQVRTVLFGETDLDVEEGLTVFISDYPFTCEDLTQLWTPDEVDAFPALNMMVFFIGEAEVGEYDTDASDLDDRSEAWFIRFDDGLDYEWDEDFFYAEDGAVTINDYEEGKSVKGEFDYDLRSAENSDDETLKGNFRARFCRNLSIYEDSQSLLGSLLSF